MPMAGDDNDAAAARTSGAHFPIDKPGVTGVTSAPPGGDGSVTSRRSCSPDTVQRGGRPCTNDGQYSTANASGSIRPTASGRMRMTP